MARNINKVCNFLELGAGKDDARSASLICLCARLRAIFSSFFIGCKLYSSGSALVQFSVSVRLHAIFFFDVKYTAPLVCMAAIHENAYVRTPVSESDSS